MKHTGFFTLGVVLLTSVLVSAQDPPGPKKIPVDLIKEAPDGVPELDPKKDPGGGGGAKGEDPKEIIARLHKNMEAANIQLKDKNDPTEPTRKIQTDIIDDLDKLIKQQKDNESC